jgi:hypothetical protein
MRSIFVAALVILLATVATPTFAVIVTQWDFNSNPPDANPSTGLTTPSIGAGTLTQLGTSGTAVTGSPGDPAAGGGDNSAFNTSSYPSQGTGSGTEGVQFAVSTVGFTDIVLSVDLRQSPTASRYWQLLVSSDGTSFAPPSGGVTSFGTIGAGNTGTSFSTSGVYANDPGPGSGQTFVQAVTYTFASGSAFEDNPNFKYQWVSIFDPADGGYISADTGLEADYGTTGTFRFDMVTVAGTAIPEPGAILFGGLMCCVVALWRLTSKAIAPHA